MDLSQYLEIFIEESKEHLQSMNVSLLELEGNPSNPDLINVIFRVAHTLKGMSATMGFKRMQKLTHDSENVLSEIRNGKMSVTAELLDVLFKCLDALEKYVELIAETSSEGEEDNQDLIDMLNAILKSNGAAPQASTPKVVAQTVAPKVESKVADTASKNDDKNKHREVEFKDFEIHAIKRASEENFYTFGMTIHVANNCVLKSARAFIVFRTLENLGQVIKSIPPVQDIEDEKFDTDFSVFVVTKESKDRFKKDLMSIAEIVDVCIDDVVIPEEKPQEEINSEEDVEVSDKKSGSTTPTAGQTQGKAVANRTVRVDIERLDNLMNLVSELIIIKNGLETVDLSTIDTSFNEQIEYLERVTTNLHESVMKVRMVPVERVFNRFPRLIRDLSRDLNKKINLNMSGEETELDRTVIDEIGDPLVHLLRNAADHGLETPAVRVANGKNEEGTVNLTAYQDGNNVVIEVGDDGNGINVEKVKQKALKTGAISSEQAANMSDQEIIDLLFRPSFSTAEVISDVSGRGVGLDVVKTKIEALGGDIEVRTKLGSGSKFIIRLPLTLAIIQALMVSLGNEKYAIPLSAIQNIEDIHTNDIKYIQNQQVINLRGQVIPIIYLDKVLDVPKDGQKHESMTVVIVNKGDRKAGLVVDGLIGQQEIVIKALGKYLTHIKVIAGATILGNGEVALIIDTNTLF